MCCGRYQISQNDSGQFLHPRLGGLSEQDASTAEHQEHRRHNQWKRGWAHLYLIQNPKHSMPVHLVWLRLPIYLLWLMACVGLSVTVAFTSFEDLHWIQYNWNGCDKEITVAIASCEQALRLYCKKAREPPQFMYDFLHITLQYYLSAMPLSSSGRNFHFLNLRRLKLGRCHNISKTIFETEF